MDAAEMNGHAWKFVDCVKSAAEDIALALVGLIFIIVGCIAYLLGCRPKE